MYLNLKFVKIKLNERRKYTIINVYTSVDKAMILRTGFFFWIQDDVTGWVRRHIDWLFNINVEVCSPSLILITGLGRQWPSHVYYQQWGLQVIRRFANTGTNNFTATLSYLRDKTLIHMSTCTIVVLLQKNTRKVISFYKKMHRK